MSIILRNQFLRNIITVVTGTAFAQLITMVASPFITRIYGPTEYGVLGIFMSLTLIITPIVALQLPIAIVLSEDDNEVDEIIITSIITASIISMFSFLLIILSGNKLLDIIKIEINSYFLYLIPPLIIFSAILQISHQLAIRREEFKKRADVAVIQSSLLNFLNIFIGLAYPKGLSLIVISVISQILHGLHLLKKLNFNFIFFRKYKVRDFINIFKKTYINYYDFPKYRAPQVLINGLSESAPIILLTIYFGPVTAGFFFLAKKVLDVPVILIGNAIGDVFYPKITNAFNQGKNTFKILLKSNIALVVIGLIPFCSLFFLAPMLFELIYGDEWTKAGEYARWLSLYLFGMFITRTTIKVLPVYRIQKFHLIFTVISFVLRILSIVIVANLLRDDLITVIAYSGTSLILYVYLAIYVLLKGKFISDAQKNSVEV